MKDKNHIKEDGRNFLKFSYIVRNRYQNIVYLDRGLFGTAPEPILVWIDYTHKNEYIIIPASYVFDFGSVPTWGRWVAEKDEYLAFLVHDRLQDKDASVIIKDLDNLSPRMQRLKKHGRIADSRDGKIEFLYNRKFSDIFMYELIVEENRNILRIDRGWRESTTYYAVRI